MYCTNEWNCQLHATKHNISQTAAQVYNRVFHYYYSVCGGGGEHAPKARFFSMIYVVKSNMMLVNVVCL